MLADPAVRAIDARCLENLVGYQARRVALAVIERFFERMAPYDLRPVPFSVLSLVRHNRGITAARIGAHLSLKASNLVGMVAAMERRGLLAREPLQGDRRARGLALTAAGERMMAQAEVTARVLEDEVAGDLSAAERGQLLTLLQKVYRRRHETGRDTPLEDGDFL